MDNMNSVYLCVLVISLQFVCGYYSTTPCPGVFDFVDDGYSVHGKIILQPIGQVSTLVVRINFTIAAQLFDNYVGRLDAHDSNHLLQRYNQGQPVTYLVHFPVTSPLPKLTALTVNGDTICYGPGDVPQPNQYVTTLSLQHTSFLQGGGGIPVNNVQQPQRRPQTRPQQRPQNMMSHILFGDDEAQIYTFNDIEPTWTTGNSPFYIVNNTRPITQPTQQYQPQTQQYQPQTQQYQPQTQQNQPPTQQIYQSQPIYEHDEPSFQVPAAQRPVKPVNPVYAEPVTLRPVVETAELRPAVNSDSDHRFSDSTIECGVIAGGNERIPLIYNGKSYTRGDIPWLVAIYKSDTSTLQFICGGTLLSDRHVVTAAHCMHRRSDLTSMRDIVVKVGVHNLNDWSDDITVTRTLIDAAFHEEYSSNTLKNDILMLTLNKAVPFNAYIRPACLWSGDTSLSRVVGTFGVVAGWGDKGPGGRDRQGEPHMVRVPIVSTNDCRASKSTFHDLTNDGTFCAGDRNGAGPCVGDSGGGMFILEGNKWRARGVVSLSLRAENGDNTCNLNEYVIFTDVAQYLPWIRKILSEKHFD